MPSLRRGRGETGGMHARGAAGAPAATPAAAATATAATADEASFRRYALLVGALLACCFALVVALVQVAGTSPTVGEGEPPTARSWAQGVLLALCVPVCVAWSVWVGHRCPDAYVRRCLAVVAALLNAWIAVVFVKWSCASDLVNSVLWYLYYVPMLVIPTLGLFCVMRSAAVDRTAPVRALKRALVAVDAALVLLVLTNNLHHQVFLFSFDDPGWSGSYAYGWGYWVVFAWDILQAALIVALAYVASCRRLHGAVAVVALVLAMAAVFCLLYVGDVGYIRTNLAVMFSVMTMTAFEACLDLGILPSYRRWDALFARLPFDLKVLSNELEVAYATDCASPLDPAVRERVGALRRKGIPCGRFEEPASCPHRLFEAYAIEGGTALLGQDTAAIDARRASLEEKCRQLGVRNALLERDHAVRMRLHRQDAERELADEVQLALARATDRMAYLAEVLAGGAADGPAGEGAPARRRCLTELRLLLAYCKRKGALVLEAADGLALDAARLALVADETGADLRGAGYTCGALLDVAAPIGARTASVLYDCLYACVLAAAGADGPVLMANVAVGADGSVRLSVALEVAGDENLEKVVRAGLIGALAADGAAGDAVAGAGDAAGDGPGSLDGFGGFGGLGGCSCTVESAPGELHVAVEVAGVGGDEE